jgi:membrane protease YdiL (CAAX protease family)
MQMSYSRIVCLFACLPVGAWAAASFGFDLQPEQCSDTWFHFKLLLWGPIVEEIVFRAGLQRRLMGYFHNHWTANGIASVAFSLMHFVLSPNVGSLMVFAPSVILGWVYQYTGKVAWSIGLHSAFNLLFISYLCSSGLTSLR